MDLNSQQKMRVNLQDADDVACDECENTYFSPAIIIKRVSALLSPTGQEMMRSRNQRTA